MAKRASAEASDRLHISGDRAGRLYRLLKVLGDGSAPRVQLIKRLKVGMRTFYRDVDLLRARGVPIETTDGGYLLGTTFEEAIHRIPFPDPELTFGEVIDLMKGRSSSHQKLRARFERVTK